MPIPSLPIEIVIKIASHLYDALSSVNLSAVKDGKAVSLVCRSWYPIGQELRWRSLQVDIVAVPSLLVHFDLHPHLPRLVKTLKQVATESYIEVVAEKVGFGMLPTLLNTLQELRFLDLKYVHSTFLPVFQAAANLPHLGVFKSLVAQRVKWSEDLASIFNAGFPSLKQFDFVSLAISTTEDDNTLASALRNLKNLRQLSLAWWSGESFNVFHSILSNLDPTALRRVLLAGVPAIVGTYEWLVKCPNLRHLTIAIIDVFLASNLPTLLANLTKSKSLEFVDYKVFGVENVNTSPMTLNALLTTLPSSLIRFQARELIFPDSNSTEDRLPARPFDDKSLCGIRGMVSTSEGNRCVMFWKERKDEKSAKWYRCILDFSTWDEYDARISESA